MNGISLIMIHWHQVWVPVGLRSGPRLGAGLHTPWDFTKGLLGWARYTVAHHRLHGWAEAVNHLYPPKRTWHVHLHLVRTVHNVSHWIAFVWRHHHRDVLLRFRMPA